jgi:hypothetical protein
VCTLVVTFGQTLWLTAGCACGDVRRSRQLYWLSFEMSGSTPRTRRRGPIRGTARPVRAHAPRHAGGTVLHGPRDMGRLGETSLSSKFFFCLRVYTT